MLNIIFPVIDDFESNANYVKNLNILIFSAASYNYDTFFTSLCQAAFRNTKKQKAMCFAPKNFYLRLNKSKS